MPKITYFDPDINEDVEQDWTPEGVGSLLHDFIVNPHLAHRIVLELQAVFDYRANQPSDLGNSEEDLERFGVLSELLQEVAEKYEEADYVMP